jgi:iron(III) transport system ATP-binding protein
MSTVEVQSITKRFDDTVAVDAVDVTVEHAELFFLLGPSGCGKTTLLRMIAGFVEPSAGRILFGGRDMTPVPPNRRGTGMVFQSYALWPHMSVAENVAYGLRVAKVARRERQERVQRALATVQMEAYAERRPNQLSGGQQQRVALARALVVEPTVLLLDEPLSNLDARLRLEMRSEIRRICKAANITTVYVTHDQKEALSMADRIAVLREGRVEQVGTPREVYDRPRSRFVAEFVGETNFLAAEVTAADGDVVVLQTAAGTLRSTAAANGVRPGEKVTCSVRPEALRVALTAGADASNRLVGKRITSLYLGDAAQHVVALTGGEHVLALEVNPRPFAEAEEPIALTVDPHDVVVLSD